MRGAAGAYGCPMDPATLAPARLEDLQRDLGLDSTVLLVRTFLEALPARLDEVEQASSGADAVVLRRSAHTVASSAALVGADVLADAARAVERTEGPVDAVRSASVPAARALRAWLLQHAHPAGAEPRP